MPLLTLSGHSRRCGRKSLIAIVDLEIRPFASAAGEGCSIRQSHGFVICRAGRASCRHSLGRHDGSFHRLDPPSDLSKSTRKGD